MYKNFVEYGDLFHKSVQACKSCSSEKHWGTQDQMQISRILEYSSLEKDTNQMKKACDIFI